ncbi:MAG: phosphate starvation-inducible PhoH-like protein [Pirellulaceae bacterium]|jgi:phosphate starvation-inducible PhoH-like protein
MSEATIMLSEPQLALSLFGAQDQHLKQIRETFNVTVFHRDGKLHLSGEDKAVAKATEAFEQLKQLAERQGSLADDDVASALATVNGKPAPGKNTIDVINAGKRVAPRTEGQARYVEALRKNDLVFALGPAGTGKTYLAVAVAVEALKQHLMRKIVLVRPAVEAGESLGFLPGDLQAKINPYLRPLLDALHEMVDYDQIKRYMEQDVIEVVPLAYMRGRTLNDAFIILDEAQNSTASQMKMFLTRMGANSKVVVAGDTTQVDLAPNQLSGLTDALMRLRKIDGVSVVELSKNDIVRHRLVREIVRAYDEPIRKDGKQKSTR